MMENFVNKIINGDCIEVMKTMPENSIDLIVTSPPYGVGIEYDTFDDDLQFEEYRTFSKEWLIEAYRVLKDDGRIALNVPYEINRQDKGGRIFMIAELWSIMQKIGYKFYGLVDLDEQSPHRSKTTAWGSWMSPSAPYIYNPKECVLLCYKNRHIKKVKGEPEWVGVIDEVEQEDGTKKKKKTGSSGSTNSFPPHTSHSAIHCPCQIRAFTAAPRPSPSIPFTCKATPRSFCTRARHFKMNPRTDPSAPYRWL